jgi:hypothetical protein
MPDEFLTVSMQHIPCNSYTNNRFLSVALPASKPKCIRLLRRLEVHLHRLVRRRGTAKDRRGALRRGLCCRGGARRGVEATEGCCRRAAKHTIGRREGLYRALGGRSGVGGSREVGKRS